MESVDQLLAATRAKHCFSLLPTKVEISARVTVFFAAAGFGKTFAMLDACERLRRQGASVAWLSCAALALPQGGVTQAIQRFFELFAAADAIFVDDIDILSREQRKALLQAFALTAPQHKIVLATRSLDELGVIRLVAAGSAQVIQADSLRWRRRQLSELWKSRLSARQIDFIEDLAEGWPAVSQLLARFIVEGGEALQQPALMNASMVAAYIRGEVLSSFKSSELSLLAMTSLVDAFDATLLKRLSASSSLNCDELVSRLPGLCTYREGGTLIAYNRALALQLQQIFSTLPDHARYQALRHAADWAAARGGVAEAVRLAVRAGDKQRVVDYVVNAGGLKIQSVKGTEELRAVLDAAGEALVEQEAQLKLLKCVILLKDGRVREASRLYAEALPDLPSDADTEKNVASIRLFLMVCGCRVSVMTDAEVSRVVGSFNQDPLYCDIVPTILAVLHSQQANFDAAAEQIEIARAYAREAHTTYNLMFLDVHAAVAAQARGDLESARTSLARARQRWRKDYPSDQAIETVMLSVGAQLAFEGGSYRQAKKLVGQVRHRLAHSEAWLDIYFAGYEPLFRLMARDEGLPAALAAIDRSLGQLQEAGLERIAVGLRNIGTCLIGEQILRGAEDLSLSRVNEAVKVISESWQEKEFRLLASAYRHLADRKPRAAREALDTLISFAEQHGLLRSNLRALLLRQVANDLLGEDASASADFCSALRLGARTGMRQAFIEFGGHRVKARLSEPMPEQLASFAKELERLIAMSPHNQPGTVLTRREQQVLELLAEGGSDKGIARQLQVTEYTVWYHLKNIYRKLGVHDRNAAITRYRAE
jgi:LuxR family maltose regulon positive regulatory protein